MAERPTSARPERAPRPEKVAAVEEIRSALVGARGALLTEYRGLKVADLARLRRAVTAAGGRYQVLKNTLVRRAADEAGLGALAPLLEGPTAVAFAEGDVAAVAKALREFAQANPALVLKGGVLDGALLSAADTVALADLPPREVLLARLAGALAAPMTNMAAALAAVPRSFAFGLRALVEKGGAQAA